MNAGHVRLQQPITDVTNAGNLFLYSLDELEAMAVEEGVILALLEAKWKQVYKSTSPRWLFTLGEMRDAIALVTQWCVIHSSYTATVNLRDDGPHLSSQQRWARWSAIA